MGDGRLSAELLERVRARAADPGRRSDNASLAANSVPIETLFAGLPPIQDPAIQAHVDHAQNMLSRMMGMFGGAGGGPTFAAIGPGVGFAGGMMSLGGPAEAPPLPAPCGEGWLGATEASLGFALPPALRQLYAEVADGGFGPGGGLYSLDALTAKWRELTAEPVGPQGQAWPRNLLPIAGERWDLTCLDRDSGRLVFWDVEELADDEEDDPGDAAWKRSFQPEAESLDVWLGRWLDGPTEAERIFSREV